MTGVEVSQQTEVPSEFGKGSNKEQHIAESRWWKRLTGPDWVTAIATFMIFLATAVYVYYARKQWRVMSDQLSEMRSGSLDTHALAVAAGKQADAAKAQSEQANEQTVKMAESLTETKKLIRATNDLAVQAKRQADSARDALAITTELFQQDRRPWLGFQGFKCDTCTPGKDGSVGIAKMTGWIENTGKTPAVNVAISTAYASLKASYPIPDYDSIERPAESSKFPTTRLPPDEAAQIAAEMRIAKRLYEPPEVVIPPGAPWPLPLVAAGMGMNITRKFRTRIEDQMIFYVVGKITYHSIWKDKEHTTEFCLMNRFGADFQFCPRGNWMN